MPRARSAIIFLKTALLLGHLEKQQIRELLHIIAIQQPVIPQDIAVGATSGRE